MFNNGLKKVVADLAEQVQQLAANADGHFGQHGLKSSNHSQDHEKHHHFSLATTTIPYYHLIVDCLNMLGPSPFPHAPSMPLEKVALALESTRGSRAGEGQGRGRGGEVVAGKGSLMTGYSSSKCRRRCCGHGRLTSRHRPFAYTHHIPGDVSTKGSAQESWVNTSAFAIPHCIDACNQPSH